MCRWRHVAERILGGEITSVLPSLMELTEQTGLAPNTIRRAIKILIDEGIVYTVPGRGTFVRPPGGETPRQP